MELKLLTLKRMTDLDAEEFLSLEKAASVPRIYNPIVTEEDALEEIRDHELFFITNDTTIVGTISYQKKSDGSVYLSNLAVLPEFRSQGIARRGMEMILEIVGEAPKIWLVVHPENEKALRLYISLGFVEEKRIENYYGDGEPRLVLVRQSRI